MSKEPSPAGSSKADGEQLDPRGYTRRMMDAVPDLVYVVDESPSLVDWNEALVDVTGYSDAELADKGIEAFFAPEHYPRIEEAIREAFETGETVVEAPLLTKSGEQIPYEFTASRTQGPHGDPVIVGAGRDVSTLRQRTRKLQTLIDNLPGVVYRCRNEPGWPMENVEGECGELTGYPAEALERGEVEFGQDVIHPEDRDRVWQEVQRAVEAGEPFELDYRVVTADGETRWVWERGRGIHGEDGQPEALEGFITDVTEKRSAQRELAESEARFRQIAENLDAAIWLSEMTEDVADARVLYLSPQFEEMFDLPRERIQDDPMTFLERIHPDDLERIQAEMEAITPEHPGFEVECRIQLDDGTVRHMRTEGIPIETPEGQPDRLAGISQDVTELEVAQRELEVRNRAIENAPIGVILTDPRREDNPIVDVNRRFLDLTGYEEDEVLGRNCRFLQGEDTDEERVAEIRGAIEDEQPVTVELLNYRKDGTPFWNRVTVAPVRAGGDVTHFVGFQEDVTEEVERRAAIERERDRRAALFDENVDPITEVEFHGETPVITDVNAAFTEVFGYEADEVRGTEVSDAVVPPEGRREHENLAERARRGEPVEAEVVRRTAEGPRRFSLQVIPLPPDGEEPRAYAWYKDLTEIRQLEREEAFKAHLLDRVGEAVNAIDPDGTIRYWNEHAEELFGYAKEDAIGENIYELIGAHEEHVEEIREHMERGEEWTGELTIEHPDGSEIQAVFTKEPILDEEGGFDGVIGVTYDVTELRELEREEAFKARMLDQVGQAVIATDADGNVTYWNQHAEELYGYTSEEAEGKPIMDLTVPDTEEGRETAEAILEAVTQGETWTGEFEARRKDGSTFPALVSDSPVTDEDGELVGVIGVSQDISSIKDTQRELARTANRLQARNRELRELSQATAHTFRTPIWDTTRYLELLGRQAGDKLDEEETDHLETALDGAHRLHDLVESLQEYLDASTREVGAAASDAGDVLDAVLETMSARLDETGAEVEVDGPAPEVAVDGESLAEVFRHLFENAVVFSGDDPPRIEVGFEREGDMWVVAVRDNGLGIDPQYHERVFHPFRTLHSHVEGGGPGLGLALCRGIVEAHGGHIWLDSEPGEGTTVYMTLPDADAPPIRADAPGAVSGPGDGEPDVFADDVELFED